jgi:hypothetical protein
MCQDGSRKVLHQLALSGSAHHLFLFETSSNNYLPTLNLVISRLMASFLSNARYLCDGC